MSDPHISPLPPRPSTLHIWWLAARPKTLWASIAPVLIGGSMAWGDGLFHAPSVVAALLGALLIQIGTNFCNDYADFKKGADTEDRMGPLRATASGWISAPTMWRATVLTFTLAALTALYLIYRGGWPMAVIAVLSILFGVLYTVGPYALAYRGWSEGFALVFFGPVAVAGTYYVQTMQWPWIVIVAGLAPGLMSCAILSINNLRDIKQDRVANKRTLAVRFGKTFARWEYTGCVVLSLLLLPLLLFYSTPHRAMALIPLAAALGAVGPLRDVWRGMEGPALNEVLARTGKLLLIQSVLFSVGWIWK